MKRLIYKELARVDHVCSRHCLGPLTFDQEAKGSKVTLSLGARRAERLGDTFRDALVFSSRPVQVDERVRLRVERTAQHWHGALRLGFTSVCPKSRDLPTFAIPDLTDTPGHWACLIPINDLPPGTELQFWVTHYGQMQMKMVGRPTMTLLDGLDVTRPLWAMLDVYGQTCAVLLLGSEKKRFVGTKTSCPVPPPPPVSVKDSCLCASENFICEHQIKKRGILREKRKRAEHLDDCVACMTEKADVILTCGHQCLCSQCVHRVLGEFGTCPLCREPVMNFMPLWED